MNTKINKINLRQIIATTILATSTAPVFAQATFLIWPIYPKIEANEKATAVWLENTGKSDAMVQIRVFNWEQKDYQDTYNEQNQIIPSPPIAKIKAGERHMLRLTQSVAVSENKEQAYRIIVDELPIKLDQNEAVDASKVSFQMRYSIPLFTYGKGVGSGLDEASQKINSKNPNAKPVLSWWIKNNQNKSELYIRNTGKKFARISGIKLNANSEQFAFQNVSFGYILAESTMKFDLNPDAIKKIESQKILYAVDSSGVTQENLAITKAE